MTAFNAGGCRAASWRLEKPPHEYPVMPTEPSHQGCAAIQAIASTPSSCSRSVYSSSMIPSESPVPRMSIRTPA